MLTRLHIQNFAIISDLTLDFSAGLTVFSGETGAGKSIVIEALGFVLGARADVSTIKEGATRMCVSAQFDSASLPDSVRALHCLTADRFTLRRELDHKGKGKAYIDGRPVTVSTLLQLGRHLVDFHGQHEHQSLLHASVHLMLLDHFAKQSALVNQVQEAFTREQQLRAQLEALQLSAQEKERLLDLYGYELKEIETVNPKAEEDLQLEQLLPKLKHAGKLLSLAQEAYEELYEQDSSACSRTAKAAKLLSSMAELDENLTQPSQELTNALGILESTADVLRSYTHDTQTDPEALDKALTRHEKLKRLKAKYGPEITDVLARAEDLRGKIKNLEHAEEHEQDLQDALTTAHARLVKLARTLHDKRMSAAEKLAQQVMREIRPLGFNQIKFTVSVEMDEENIGPNGADKVEFLFSPNPGQSLRPLKNIASGGEISRVMLGLKTILAPTVPVMVFDEIDAGIGGETGNLVGKKLHEAAQGKQVLCVSHLAQVAAQADANFSVQKTANKDSTQVSITVLQGEKLTTEIARMLGGNTAKNSAAFSHAQELLKEAHRA